MFYFFKITAVFSFCQVGFDHFPDCPRLTYSFWPINLHTQHPYSTGDPCITVLDIHAKTENNRFTGVSKTHALQTSRMKSFATIANG